MLADSVGSLDGARGIPSAIRKSNKNDDNDDFDEYESRSICSKSQSSKYNSDTDEDMLCKSIRDHGKSVLQFAKIKVEESERIANMQRQRRSERDVMQWISNFSHSELKNNK